ncbi:MAG: response regulator [Elusimicrobiales bacterium]|nr:response regulator [Elusimicrobiales bacterium]
MKKRLLLADDDKAFHRVITRLFEGPDWEVSTAEDGRAALEHISARPPDVIVLDLNMPVMGGRQLLAELRRNPETAFIPVIIISGDSGPEEQAAEFKLGADDFVPKPFEASELAARIEAAVRRARRLLAANPLTFLPGGPAIEEEASSRIRSGSPLAFFYMDIDNFKAYNDNYGYLNGDCAIKMAGRVLTEVQNSFAGEDVFVGHIGGDDFVLMCDPARAEEAAASIAEKFDAAAAGLYSREDRERGYIVAKDRAGNVREFPLMSLTIAIATNEVRALDHYAKLADITAEIKKHLKGRPAGSGSAWLKDRRRD